MTEAITLRCVGGPMNGQYVTMRVEEPSISVALAPRVSFARPNDMVDVSPVVREYRRWTMGWEFSGLRFEREVLLWDHLDAIDGTVILMRAFVDLLDRQEL